MDYKGLKCGICGADFADGDDVVVCPDCGTPMHRACYKEKGGCPNADKHGEGFVFDGFDIIKDAAQGKAKVPVQENKIKLEKPQAEVGEPVQSDTPEGNTGTANSYYTRSCPICGNTNRPSANFCDNCGTRLSTVNAPSIATAGDIDYSDPQFFASYALGQASDVPASDVYEDNVTAGDVACYVGVNTPYYLGAFRKIKDGIGKFNFSAAVFSGVWFLYRKLYRPGALLLSVEALLYALKMYFTRSLSLDVMNKLLATVGMTVNNMSQLTMEQYTKLSIEMQKLPVEEQILMMMPTLLLILQIVVMIVSGSVANKLYYKRCIEQIKEVKASAAENSLPRSEVSRSLYLSGGVNAMLAGIFGFIYIFLLFM